MQRQQIELDIKRKDVVGGVWQQKVSVIKPVTFMNHSGKAVRAYAKKRSIKPVNILVLHDELDFPIGKLRFKFGGGEGGHNGLISISAHLGTRDYWRLRIGIGRPADKRDVTKYVLGKPPSEEKSIYLGLVNEVLECLEEFVLGDQQTAIKKLAEVQAR